MDVLCAVDISIILKKQKIMIEGSVDVTGSTVKIDNTTELQNLYELARS
jgi:hypothetical protein